MAKAEWPRLTRTETLAEPLSGRPVAFDATCVPSPRGRFLAVLDAVPAAGEADRDDRDALRVRVFSCDGGSFARVLEDCPKRAGYRHGDVTASRACVSDDGTVAFALGADVHVLSPSGVRRTIAAPGAWPFFDPLEPSRLRLVVRREGGEVIETHDVASGGRVDELRIGESGNMKPVVDPATGDVLLFDGWYLRSGGFVAVDRSEPGQVVCAGDETLVLLDDVEAPEASRRSRRSGEPLPVPAAFAAWRSEDRYRARAPMLAALDGSSAIVHWSGKHTLFDAKTLEPASLPAIQPRGTLSGPGVVALLSSERAIVCRSGLYEVDLRTGSPIGGGPVALYGMALAGERVVTVHEDGIRADMGQAAPLGIEPRLDGLRVAPDGRRAVVLGASGELAVVVDLVEMREIGRIDAAVSAAWVDPGRLVVHGGGSLRSLDVATGAVTSLGEVPREACLGSDGQGVFFVATATALAERTGAGVAHTHAVSKKLKGYTWPTEVVVSGKDVYLLARKRIFRVDAAGGWDRLTGLEDAIGGPRTDPKMQDGPIRSLSVSPDGQRIAATVRTKSAAVGVVIADRDGNVLGWTGPLFGRRSEWHERAWCVFRGGDLLVATEHGDLGVFKLPA